MEIELLDEAVEALQNSISEFPVGAITPDDFKPIEDKIVDLKESLKSLNARHLTLNAIIDYEFSEDNNPVDLIKSYEQLNENTTNYLINTKTLKLCYHSRAIQDIINKKASTPEIQEKVKACLNKLFTLNDRMISKTEERKEMMKKEHQLKFECYHALHDHQDFLKESEARRNRHLQEIDPTILEHKEKINRSLFKINTMKRLITNLIASMCHELHDNEELIKMLVKHKDIISLEHITELTQNQSLTKN